MKTSDLVYWYKFFNKKYFGNKLPKRLWVHFGKLPRYRMGETRFRKEDYVPHDIRISRKFKSGLGGDEMAVTTLLHEMVHVSIGGKYHHGPKFKKELRRLMTVGAFDRVLG